MGAEAEQLAQHWNAMVRSARGVLGSRDEAEDCAGHALLQVCEQAPDNVLNLEAYMVTVAKRRALDRQRHLARARRRDERFASHDRLVVSDIAEDVARRDEAMWMAAEAERLLDERSFDVLRRHAEGESMSTIAAVHGLNQGAARTILHRARKVLREVYAKGLVILGIGWLIGRRASRPATVTATALVALAFTIAPHVGDAAVPESRAPLGVAMSPPVLESSSVSASPTLDRGGVAAAPQEPARAAQAQAIPSHGPSLVVGAPVGETSTLIEKEHRGDETQDDPVTVLLDCVENFEVGPSQVGC